MRGPISSVQEYLSGDRWQVTTGFDVTADGKRFVVAQVSENPEDVDFVLITGWFEELRAKMRRTR